MAQVKDELLNERNDNYNSVRTELLARGYSEKSAVISVLKANIMAFVTAGPICIIFTILYVVVHSADKLSQSSDSNEFMPLFIFLASLLVSIPVHELLHGAGWVSFCKSKERSINFGVMWQYLTPYCHCREALTLPQYFTGLLMPLIVLGVLPCVISLITGNSLLLVIGGYNILLAGGDKTIGSLLFKAFGKKAMILDHPTECGCVIFTK